jgi:pimeloyl-ACP methyl ester carboxylesterase
MSPAPPVALSYQSRGDGPPVLLLPPAATRAEIWHSHQVPALVTAGYRAITANQRGMAPTPAPPGPYRVSDLVGDTAALIMSLGLGPCHVVGASLGAFVAQELTLAHPELVLSAVLIGTRARCDHYRRRVARAMAARGRSTGPVTELEALHHLSQLFGPKTLADERLVADWIEMMQRFPVTGAGPAAQYDATVTADRRGALAMVTRPCLVIAFGADVLTPAAACHEVAAAIPGCDYVEFDGLGHFGFLEDPALVNAALTEFITMHSPALVNG